MKITEKWLSSKNACQEGIDWAVSCKTSDPIELMKIAKKSDDLEVMRWAIWGFTRAIDKKNQVRFAVYCAEKVIHIFEEKYPEDKRPRKAIQAAKRYMKNMTEDNRRVASASASASADSAYAASYASSVYSSVASAAWAAAYAAAWADSDADSVASATDAADAAAWADSDAARKEIYVKLIKYGIRILREGE